MVTWYDLWCAELLTPAEFRRLRALSDDPAEAFLRSRDAGDDVAPGVEALDVLVDASLAGRERAERALRSSCAPGARPIETATTHARLKASTGSPFIVVGGELPDIDRRPAVAIVGTREVGGEDARRARAWLADLLATIDVVVVSGGARGIDAIAHEVALDLGRPVVAVLAGGLGHAGPASNRRAFAAIVANGGALVTVRPPQCVPQAYEFVRRNAIIAALADVTVVVRAPLTSGALVTARHSFELGRPVLAVPGRPDDSMSAGCHELLRRGGRVCTGPSDLLDALGSGRLTLDAPRPAEVASGAAPQEPDLRAIYEQIRRDGTAVDTLVLVTGLAPAQLGERLIELELDGWVERRGPAVFRAVHRS